MGYRSNQRAFETLQKLNLHHLLNLPKGEAVTRDHWAVKAIFKSAAAIPDEVKEVLGLTAPTEIHAAMGFTIDVFKKFLGFEFESKKARIPKPMQGEALEYLRHENHIKDHLCDFGVSNNDQSETHPSEKRGKGRPKKAPTIEERRYTLKPSLWRDEVIADFVTAHNAYVELEPIVEVEAETVTEADVKPVVKIDDHWFSPECLKDIRETWALADSEELRTAIKAVIPIAVLERAIAA